MDDRELFVEQSVWMAPHLESPTIGEFACWLAPWLSGGTKAKLETLYRLNHPAQRAAEAALVELLESAPEQHATRWVLQDDCGRNTDWPSSLALAHPLPTTRFVQGRSMMALDQSLLAALANVARKWCFLLTEYGGYAETHQRVATLRKVARWRGRGQLTSAHLKRLGRSPDLRDDVRALRDALELMAMPLHKAQAREALANLAQLLNAPGSAELENCNDALEVSAILSIARCAESLGWRVNTADAGRSRPKPRLRLTRGPLRCAISKGQFEYPEQPQRRVVDVLAKMQRDALGLPGGAGQPDVVISFWHAAAPENVLFAIADAKRNEAGDGLAYLKRSVVTMAAYMVAFAQPLGVRVAAEHGGFVAPLMPTATLFLRQGTNLSSVGTEQRFTRPSGRASSSWLECLGPQQYAQMHNDVWQANGMHAWFSRLTESAVSALSAVVPRGS